MAATVCGRSKTLTFCHWVLIVVVLVAFVEVLQLHGPLSSTKVVRSKEDSTLIPLKISTTTHRTSLYQYSFRNPFENGNEERAISVQPPKVNPVTRNRPMIFKGKPHAPRPSPHSPTPLSQPTLGRPTLPRKQPHFFHRAIKSTRDIFRNAWVTQLQEKLGTIHLQKQVTIVFSNSDYLEALLNWLIAAKVRLSPPIANLLVISLDQDVFSILNQRAIPSVHINPDTVINMTQLSFPHTIWMTRFVVFRLINYWGYDFVSFDTDAIIMKHPRELFEQHPSSDIVGSAGRFPHFLGREWGFTVCMGVVMFKSTPRTELLWESIIGSTDDDQVMLNIALKACYMQWQGNTAINNSVDGRCRRTGLRVTVLPQSEICRYRCSDQKGFHIWHQLVKKVNSLKKSVAKENHVWYLRDDWISLDSVGSNGGKFLKDTDWLALISVS